MKTKNADQQRDEFEPIELGSVSEETKGAPLGTNEYGLKPNSQDQG